MSVNTTKQTAYINLAPKGLSVTKQTAYIGLFAIEEKKRRRTPLIIN